MAKLAHLKYLHNAIRQNGTKNYFYTHTQTHIRTHTYTHTYTDRQTDRYTHTYTQYVLGDAIAAYNTS